MVAPLIDGGQAVRRRKVDDLPPVGLAGTTRAWGRLVTSVANARL
jgi:hypothetical protein